jgi:outer membrane protein W
MRYRILVTAALLAVILSPAAVWAQTSRVEVSGIFGWTTSDGVDGNGILAGDGNIYDAIDVKDSFSWGFGIGFNATENAEVGFLFNQQMSTLRVQGTATREIGDMNVNSYHPYFAYNFLPEDSRVRPYFLIGLGATNYAGVSFAERGHPRGRALDTHLHQDRRGWLVVRPVLGLLSRGRREVRQPVPLQRRHRVPVLEEKQP